MKYAIVTVLILSIILGILFWVYITGLNRQVEEKSKTITLTYWSVNEDEQSMQVLIDYYRQTHPNVTINFVKQSLLNYRTRVQTQIQTGQGPDIFSLHNSWVPMFAKDLSTAPDAVFPDYANINYPVARDTLTASGTILAVPLEIDGLALYYNEDIIKAVAATPPHNWQEFIDIARKATVKNEVGQIQTAGAALGTTENIDYWPEIISLLFFQQPSGNLQYPSNKDGAEVLQFYTRFVTDPTIKTWDASLPSSSKMFIDGKLAFYFAPASKVSEISQSNPALNFKTIAIPQLPGKNVEVGSFWAKAVSLKSANQKASWEFIRFLSSKEALQEVYNQDVENNRIPKLLPRVDMQAVQLSDPVLGAFIAEAPYFKSWYLNSDTGDAGLNEEMIAAYKIAVNNVLQGADAAFALKSIEPIIDQILQKYGVIQPQG